MNHVVTQSAQQLTFFPKSITIIDECEWSFFYNYLPATRLDHYENEMITILVLSSPPCSPSLGYAILLYRSRKGNWLKRRRVWPCLRIAFLLSISTSRWLRSERVNSWGLKLKEGNIKFVESISRVLIEKFKWFTRSCFSSLSCSWSMSCVWPVAGWLRHAPFVG